MLGVLTTVSSNKSVFSTLFAFCDDLKLQILQINKQLPLWISLRLTKSVSTLNVVISECRRQTREITAPTQLCPLIEIQQK